MRPLLLSLLLGCGDADDPCVPLCAAAADRYGACLEAGGADWPAAGYDDRADFLDACHTWAWEARLLEADAGEDGAVDRTCRTRRAAIADGDCDTFTSIDWSTMPWE
jgi:hypothetical protein